MCVACGATCFFFGLFFGLFAFGSFLDFSVIAEASLVCETDADPSVIDVSAVLRRVHGLTIRLSLMPLASFSRACRKRRW